MALLVCPQCLLRTLLHYVPRLPEHLQTLSLQLWDLLKSDFIHSLVINRSIVLQLIKPLKKSREFGVITHGSDFDEKIHIAFLWSKIVPKC